MGETAQHQDAVLGREAASAVWQRGLKTPVETVLSRDFANGAVLEFRRLQQKHSTGIIGDFLDGAEMAAEQLNVERYHGVLEVVQNADDLHAKTLRIGLRKKGRARQLLFCHDGDPIELRDAIAMTVAFLSTKRDDSRMKGKFGIGLKTLQRLGSRLSVHCEPFHFQIEKGLVDVAEPEEAIKDFYEPAARQTLVGVTLAAGFDDNDFESWLSALGPRSLLFLDTLSRIDLFELPKGARHVSLELRREALNSVQLTVGSRRLSCSIAEATEKRRRPASSWTIYKVELPVDKKAARARAHKATAQTTGLAIAVPSSAQTGALYAGLPTRMRLGVPFSINAEFDPDTSRDSLLHNDWNRWLFASLSDLALAVAILRFQEAPASGWRAVGLAGDSVVGADQHDEWLTERLKDLVSVQHAGLRQRLRLPSRGKKVTPSSLCYEAESLEGLLNDDDLELLCPGKHALARECRDADGRWRDVLSDLDESTVIEVEDAVGMFGWNDEDLGDRAGAWYVSLATAAMDADCEDRLFDTHSIRLHDGSRVTPYQRDEGCLVTLQEADAGLGARLGVIGVADEAYGAEQAEARRLREFLTLRGAMVEKPESIHVLTALAAWDEDVPLDDADLVELRDMLDSIEADTAKALASKIGRVISVDGRTFERGKARQVTIHPADAYISPAIEKMRSSESWGGAAGKTEGLNWIHPRYAEVVTAGRDREQTGASRLFGLLGAERSPRLVRPPVASRQYGERVYGINRSSTNGLQLEQIDALNKQDKNAWASHLKNDWVSPDLQAVAEDIASMRPSRSRSDRARNLITVLDRAWRNYEHRTEAIAVHGYYRWVSMGPVPATWLSMLAGIPWMSNGDRPPKELAPFGARVRTDLNTAIHGENDPQRVKEVNAGEAAFPIVSALGIEGDPRARTVLDRLVDWRTSAPAAANWGSIRQLYVALAAHCTRTAGGRWAVVDNVAPAELRRAFTTQQLVFSNGEWFAPKDVYRGAAMFGAEKAYVPPDDAVNPLWDLLAIDSPTAEDCIGWLRRLAKRAPNGPGDDDRTLMAQMVEVYRHLFSLVPSMQPKVRRSLRTLPLLCGRRWLTSRPIYACHDGEKAAELALQGAAIWTPPCSLDGLRPPLSDLHVEVLAESSFTLSGVGPMDHVRAEPLQARFAAAADGLRMTLADRDAGMYRALSLGDWRQLQTADLAVAPELALSVLLGGRSYRLPGRAHLSLDPLVLIVADEDDFARSDRGGRLVASLFEVPEKDRWTVALAWEAAWRAAGEGSPVGGLTLLDETPEWAEGAPAEDEPPPPPGERKKRQQKKQVPEQAEKRKQKVLKDPESLTPEVEEAGSSEFAPGGIAAKTKRPLAKGKPARDPKNRAPRKGPGKEYGGDEREDVGYDLLEAIVRRQFGRDLVDCRSEPARGADAVDDLDQHYYELKVHGGPPPDHVSLTRAEAERALEKRGRYFLVVVSGVNEGETTRLTMIPDPLHNLDWHPKDDVRVGGYQSKKFPTWRFRDDGGASPESAD